MASEKERKGLLAKKLSYDRLVSSWIYLFISLWPVMRAVETLCKIVGIRRTISYESGMLKSSWGMLKDSKSKSHTKDISSLQKFYLVSGLACANLPNWWNILKRKLFEGAWLFLPFISSDTHLLPVLSSQPRRQAEMPRNMDGVSPQAAVGFMKIQTGNKDYFIDKMLHSCMSFMHSGAHFKFTTETG